MGQAYDGANWGWLGIRTNSELEGVDNKLERLKKPVIPISCSDLARAGPEVLQNPRPKIYRTLKRPGFRAAFMGAASRA